MTTLGAATAMEFLMTKTASLVIDWFCNHEGSSSLVESGHGMTECSGRPMFWCEAELSIKVGLFEVASIVTSSMW